MSTSITETCQIKLDAFENETNIYDIRVTIDGHIVLIPNAVVGYYDFEDSEDLHVIMSAVATDNDLASTTTDYDSFEQSMADNRLN